MVRVIGQLRSFNNTKNIVAFSILPVTNYNEYTFHFLEVMRTHLRHTKGPVPSAAGAAPLGVAASAMGGAAVPVGGCGGGMPGAGFAAMPAGDSVQEVVLKFFQTKGEASGDAGCTIHDAAAALGVNGVTADQVRSHVDNLVNEGHLYSTIDDDHFKAT